MTKIAKHILPVSSNLLGLSFILLSFIKLSDFSAKTIIDEILGVVVVLFLASSIFSYASMRSLRQSDFFEKVADVIFFAGLISLTLISMMIVFEIV
ncbi:MAG: hypothetical protein NT072_05550 [Deltaproteobacteria bacterium]|nr:hypothetical protein [Deltaproteobacteria bacterium]